MVLCMAEKWKRESHKPRFCLFWRPAFVSSESQVLDLSSCYELRNAGLFGYFKKVPGNLHYDKLHGCLHCVLHQNKVTFLIPSPMNFPSCNFFPLILGTTMSLLPLVCKSRRPADLSCWKTCPVVQVEAARLVLSAAVAFPLQCWVWALPVARNLAQLLKL